MILSFLTLSGLITLSVLFLWLWKPAFVRKNKKRINWGKLVSLSVVIGLLGGISVFLTMNTELKDSPNFSFKASHCY